MTTLITEQESDKGKRWDETNLRNFFSSEIFYNTCHTAISFKHIEYGKQLQSWINQSKLPNEVGKTFYPPNK